LKFVYSDLRANYTTHDMLTLSKIYAVKTRRPQFAFAANKDTTYFIFKQNLSYLLIHALYYIPDSPIIEGLSYPLSKVEVSIQKRYQKGIYISLQYRFDI